MKKFILSFFVVLATAISFSSCSDDTDTMSDDDLAKEIINYGTYSNENEADLYVLTVTASQATLVVDGDVFSKGTWTVSGGKLIITDTVNEGYAQIGAVSTFTISEEGKVLTAEDTTVLKKQ